MAANTGIEFYPMNVDFFDDDKIALIEGEFGVKGSVIAIRLLCKIYREGYYYQWGNDECLLFARKSGADIVPTTVQEVVNGLVRRSFFDKRVFDQFGVLTSRGIQQRYFEAVKRRQKVEVRREFLLVDVSKYANVKIIEPNVTVPSASATGVKPTKQRNVECPAASMQGNEDDILASEIQQLRSSPIWLEHVAMRFQLTVEQVDQRISDFMIDCRSRGTDKHESIQDAQRHFNDWLRIQLNVQNQENNGNDRKTSDKRRATKDIAQTTEDFSTSF